MAIFNSYVKLPEGSCANNVWKIIGQWSIIGTDVLLKQKAFKWFWDSTFKKQDDFTLLRVIPTVTFFWHTFWHFVWHSNWHIFWHSIWRTFWNSLWHTFWQFYLAFYLAFRLTYDIWHMFQHSCWHIAWRILAGYLTFYLAIRTARRGGGGGRDPHPAGGEQAWKVPFGGGNTSQFFKGCV